MHHRNPCRVLLSIGLWPLVLAVCVAVASPLRAADPGDDPLWRAIGDDALACFHVRNAKAEWSIVKRQAWAERIKSSGMARKVFASPQMTQFQQAAAGIEQYAGRPLGQILDELFGESFILAAYARNGGPAAVLLTRAESVSSLAAAVELWNELGEDEIRVTAVPRGSASYFRRQRVVNGDVVETVYYATEGRTLALSEDPRTLGKTLDLLTAEEGSTAAAGSLANFEPFRKSAADIEETAAVWMYFNPGVWASTQPQPPDDDPVARAIFDEVANVSAVSLSLSLREQIRLATRVYWKETAEPLWQPTAPPSVTWINAVPDDFWFASAGTIDLAPLAARVGHLIDRLDDKKLTKGRRMLRGVLAGLDPLDDLAPRLGPETLLVIQPDRSSAAVPIAWAALEFQPTGPGTDMPLVLENAMSLLFSVAVAAHNEKVPHQPWSLDFHRSAEGGPIALSIRGLPRITPAFRVEDDHLIVATSVDALPAVQIGADDAGNAFSTLSELRDRHFPAAQGFSVLRLDALRDHLAQHSDLAEAWRNADDASPDRNDWERIRETLTFFDIAWTSSEVEAERATFTLTLMMDDAER